MNYGPFYSKSGMVRETDADKGHASPSCIPASVGRGGVGVVQPKRTGA